MVVVKKRQQLTVYTQDDQQVFTWQPFRLNNWPQPSTWLILLTFAYYFDLIIIMIVIKFAVILPLSSSSS